MRVQALSGTDIRTGRFFSAVLPQKPYQITPMKEKEIKKLTFCPERVKGGT